MQKIARKILKILPRARELYSYNDPEYLKIYNDKTIDNFCVRLGLKREEFTFFLIEKLKYFDDLYNKRKSKGVVDSKNPYLKDIKELKIGFFRELQNIPLSTETLEIVEKTTIYPHVAYEILHEHSVRGQFDNDPYLYTPNRFMKREKIEKNLASCFKKSLITGIAALALMVGFNFSSGALNPSKIDGEVNPKEIVMNVPFETEYVTKQTLTEQTKPDKLKKIVSDVESSVIEKGRKVWVVKKGDYPFKVVKDYLPPELEDNEINRLWAVATFMHLNREKLAGRRDFSYSKEGKRIDEVGDGFIDYYFVDQKHDWGTIEDIKNFQNKIEAFKDKYPSLNSFSNESLITPYFQYNLGLFNPVDDYSNSFNKDGSNLESILNEMEGVGNLENGQFIFNNYDSSEINLVEELFNQDYGKRVLDLYDSGKRIGTIVKVISSDNQNFLNSEILEQLTTKTIRAKSNIRSDHERGFVRIRTYKKDLDKLGISSEIRDLYSELRESDQNAPKYIIKRLIQEEFESRGYRISDSMLKLCLS